MSRMTKEQQRERNLEAIRASGEQFEMRSGGTVLLFRYGRAKADFYPGTGRWRDVAAQGGARGGGAEAFLEWWRAEKARTGGANGWFRKERPRKTQPVYASARASAMPVPLPPEPGLGADQRRAYDAVMAGENILITGPAGTGKSYLLERIVAGLRASGRRVAVTASTGVAALNVGGSTIHRFLGTRIAGSPAELQRQGLPGLAGSGRRDLKERLLGVEVLVVDEVSMLTGDYLDMAAFWLWVARNQPSGGWKTEVPRGSPVPFDGVQVVLCGDFLQLPPVQGRGLRAERLHAFEAGCWPRIGVRTVVLRENFRQRDADFVGHLLALREGGVSAETRDFFDACVGRRFEAPAIWLVPHNDTARRINEDELARLPGGTTEFRAQFSGEDRWQEALRQHCIAEDLLRLKPGAPVIFLKNDREMGVVNGMAGRVVEVVVPERPAADPSGGEEPDDGGGKAGDDEPDEYDDYGDYAEGEDGEPRVVVRVERPDGVVVSVVPAGWDFRDSDGEVLARMRQYPVKLAWALTIHKSQGMTLDRVRCDLRGVFEAGHAYVALSRARTAAGLSLDGPLNPALIVASEEALRFYREGEAEGAVPPAAEGSAEGAPRRVPADGEAVPAGKGVKGEMASAIGIPVEIMGLVQRLQTVCAEAGMEVCQTRPPINGQWKVICAPTSGKAGRLDARRVAALFSEARILYVDGHLVVAGEFGGVSAAALFSSALWDGGA